MTRKDEWVTAERVAAADERSTATEDAMRGLLATLEATENERDEALQLLEDMEGKLIEAIVASKAQQEIAEVAKANAKRCSPSICRGEANTPPSAE